MKNFLIHGLGQTNDSWISIKNNLNKFYPEILCPNLYNLMSDENYVYNNLYDAFDEYINKFDGKVNLCGLSLGGLLALEFSKKNHSKINKLVLIAVPYKIPKFLFTVQAFIFKLMPKSTFEKIGLPKHKFISLVNSIKDLKIDENLEQPSCKTLILCGKKDRINMNSAKKLKSKIKTSELIIIKDSGHEVNLDNPEELSNILIEFLD
ncbi:MAG: alpha/beta hydrolase [Peptoniphilaceae bacterium]|nr:alpha/beta hydrolase [Peptoniphilaceae bacterium]MDD7382882.1 alpha/beta hydrolase [Peptoniphilaceae bacterium]MDY3738159.1 alpha/beta hydrolase [Peptoniphilaceae bacterium]